MGAGRMSRGFFRQQGLLKIARISTWIVLALILGGSIRFLLVANFFEAAVALAGLLIVVTIQFGSRRLFQVNLPPQLQLAVSFFSLVSLYIGRSFHLYRTVPYFDKSMHFLYGMMFTIIGLIVFFRANQTQSQKLTVRSAFIIVYLIGFAMTCSFIWELFEFACDRLFGSDMQAWQAGGISGLTDTIADLLSDFMGALLAASLIGRDLRRGARSFLTRFGKTILISHDSGQAGSPREMV